MSEKTRIILADDHKILLAGLKMTVNSWDDFEVVGDAGDGAELVAKCDELLPELVLTDMQMPKMSGTEAAKIIKKKHPGIKVVALTTFDDPETVMQAVQADCDGFLLKVIEPAQLHHSLQAIMNGINTFDALAMKQLKSHLDTQNSVGLSDREKEILKLICQGDTNKEIADKLGLQAGTVKNLVSLLLSKTECVSRADLTRFAMEHHLA